MRRGQGGLSLCVGVWLSLVEYSVRDRGVAGSNPVTPTIDSFLLPPRSWLATSTVLPTAKNIMFDESSLLPLLLSMLPMLLAYLCGCIPTGEIIGRRLGIAVRESGSRNIGATNVARTAGKKAGILTLVGDMLKGLIPVLVVRQLELGENVEAGTALATVLGHMFSIFLSFSGGKGIATGFGAFLGLAPQAMLLAIFPLAVLFGLTKIVSISSLAATIATPILLAVFGYPGPYLMAGFVTSLLIIVRHRENIMRLWKGEESRLNI